MRRLQQTLCCSIQPVLIRVLFYRLQLARFALPAQLLMDIRYTQPFLNKLEEILSESDYMLRYEKGNFQSGYCVLKDTKVIVINKYYTLEGKINCLLELLRTVPLEQTRMSEKNQRTLQAITQTSLNL